MEMVTGIGGFFYRATDPEALAEWYEATLGVRGPRPTYEEGSWWQQPGPTVVAPFPSATEHFGTSWMINFRVSDLDAMVAQLEEHGIAVEVDLEAYPNGRFARLHDPEGNPVELWEPAGADAVPPGDSGTSVPPSRE